MPTGKPKILRFIARLNVGGPAQHVVWVSDGLKDRYDTLLVHGLTPPNEADMSDLAARAGVRTHVLTNVSRELGPKDLPAFFTFLRLLMKEKPDLLHTHTAKAGALGRAAGWLSRLLTGRPRVIVHTFHGHVLHGYWGPRKHAIFRLIERVLARFATDRIIVLSPRQYEEIHETYHVGHKEQFHIIPLGLPLEHLATPSPAAHPSLTGPGFKVGSAGRLTAVKNFPMLVHAVAALPDATLILAGTGEEQAAIEAAAAGSGLGARLRLIGLVTGMAAFYPYLDVFAITSVNEGTPLALIEAMASGIPAVCTRVGGIPDMLGPVTGKDGEVWTHERGLSTPEGAAAAFAQALAQVQNDPQAAATRAQAAQTHAMATWSVSRLVQDLDSLYKTLIF